MPRIKTRYLAFIREETKKIEEEIDLPSNSTIYEYLDELLRRYAGLRKYLLNSSGELRDGINIALNGDVIPRAKYRETILKDGDELVIIPPISGGSFFYPSVASIGIDFFLEECRFFLISLN
ncbi:MAG: MoaD family protein [Thaumarchaeota archaeon]|jgi:MoaD family protein|nr:MoaD family protein [Candidatus Geocrenenecus arthurdayi]